MKLFSRTSLVAFGTAAAVAASALTAPAFAEGDDAAAVIVQAEDTTPAEVTTSAESTTSTVTATATRTVTATPTQDPSGSSDMDNVNDWIKIITAVIGALTTILTFASNLDRFMAR